MNRYYGVLIMQLGKKIKNYCNDCHHETWHTVLFVKTEKGTNDEISWAIDYAVLQCAGCDRICFRTETSDSESYDIDEFGKWIPCIGVENYPSTNEGLGEVENLYEVPNEIRTVYEETVKSITDKCYTLAGIGLRATIEAICNHENIQGRDLNTRINRLVTNGFISKDEASKLHAIRFIGNDAAHEIKAPIKNQIIIALKIIEHIIYTKYAKQDEINKYLELPINTYNDFKNLLNKKITHGLINSTFTLQSIIGKDKRRFSEEDLSNYIKQYESDIQSGLITIIEDVTAEIQKSSTGIKTNEQRIYRKKNNIIC